MGRREDLLAELQRRGIEPPQDRRAQLIAEIEKRGLNAPSQTESYTPIGQGIKEGVKKAFPAAGNMLKAVGAGFNDIAGGNEPPSQNQFRDTLMQMLGLQNTNISKAMGLPQDSDPYTAKRAGQVGASRLMQGSRAVLNAPANAVDYLREGGYVPDWMRAARPNEAVQNANYDEIAGVQGQRPGDEIFGQVGLIPSLVATGGNPYAAIGLNAVGENQNPIEQMLGAGILHVGAKAAPKVAKAIPKAASKSIEVAKQLSGKITPDWLTKEKAGRTVGEPAKALKNKVENKYSEIREKAANENITADIPRHTFREIKDTYPGLPDDTVRLVDNAFRTGEFNDLHKADVQLGRNKQDNFKDITGKIIKQDAFDNATKLEGKIKDYMEKALEKSNPELAKEWFENKGAYANELGPLLDIPAIKEYMKGDLSPADLTRLLQSNTKSGNLFRARMASEYKAIGRNKFMHKLKELGVKGGMLTKFMLLAGGG